MSESPRLRLPHPLVLLTGCVIIAALVSYVVGQFDRRADDVTGRTLVVPGTFQTVPSNPVNLFDAMVALPVGMADAASIIFLVFLIGGAFTVVDESRTPLPRDHHVSTRLVSVQGSLAPPRHRLAATRKNAVVKCRARP